MGIPMVETTEIANSSIMRQQHISGTHSSDKGGLEIRLFSTIPTYIPKASPCHSDAPRRRMRVVLAYDLISVLQSRARARAISRPTFELGQRQESVMEKV
jgi:hypothetical protein